MRGHDYFFPGQRPALKTLYGDYLHEFGFPMDLQNEGPQVEKQRNDNFQHALPIPFDKGIHHHVHVRQGDNVPQHGQYPSNHEYSQVYFIFFNLH